MDDFREILIGYWRNSISASFNYRYVLPLEYNIIQKVFDARKKANI